MNLIRLNESFSKQPLHVLMQKTINFIQEELDKEKNGTPDSGRIINLLEKQWKSTHDDYAPFSEKQITKYKNTVLGFFGHTP